MSSMPESRGGRIAAFSTLAVSLVIIAAAQRDLHARAADRVRGDKRIWRLVCLNAMGALAYFRWGRRE
jgi:hypothetical protein